MLRHLVFYICLACPAMAAESLSPEAFEAYTEGKTLFFSQNGQDYGAERYLSDRRVQWSFLDGECKEGRWYPDGQNICFIYEDRPDPQCWQFSLTPQGLSAVFVSIPGAALELYEAREGDDMVCLGLFSALEDQNRLP